jgi:hypothetical protein
LETHIIPGDSFYSYHSVQAELPRNTNAKQFVALLMREKITKADGKEYNHVHVAQVKDVSPVFTYFSVHLNTLDLWFYAPVVDLDQKEMAQSLIGSDESWITVAPTINT